MSDYTQYQELAAQVKDLSNSPTVAESEATSSELTLAERYVAKVQARKHMDKGNIANARKAIEFIQSCENLEQAKLFVKSLQPKY